MADKKWQGTPYQPPLATGNDRKKCREHGRTGNKIGNGIDPTAYLFLIAVLFGLNDFKGNAVMVVWVFLGMWGLGCHGVLFLKSMDCC